jgi:hypothetical protein
MKKFFTFVAALMAVVAVNATVVTLTPGQFTAGENLENFSGTVDGITVAIAPKTTITADQIRVFKNSTITISAEKEISGIVFTCTANGETKYGPGCFAAQDGYSFEGKVGTWVGTPAASVAFTASSNQVRTTKIEVYLDGETPGIPTPQETVKVDVAGAIAAGQALADGKTSEEVYEVTGFVVNAEAYSTQHKNQIWWMADDAENTGAQEFEAYACTVSENSTIMQVLNGDKVTLTGNITKYVDSKNDNKVIIEIKNGTAVFVSKVDGDHSIDGGVTPPAEDLDTITVAKALEIGGALPSGGKTDVQYVIEGYVSDIVTYYDPTNDFETFWMTDDKTSTAKTNADGAFEVYKGNPVQKMEAGLHGHVYVTAKITNYNGTTIETSGSASVNIVEQGTVDEVEVITVAKALELGEALADKGTTAKRYEITGYVANVYNFLNPDYGSETLWITDDPESTSTENAFQIYRGKPNTKTATGLHAKVKVVTKIKKYGSTIETDGSTIPFEVLEASTFVPDTVNVEEVVNLTEPLAENAKTPVYYVVKGFIQEPGTFDSKNSNATFKLSQFPNEAEGLVTAYRATVLKDDAEKVATKNSYVNVTGYLMKKGGAQIAQGAITAFVEAPQTDTIHVNVAEAVAEGLKLPMGGKSDRIYAVTGFVNLVSEEFAEGVESFFLADDATSEAYNFFAAGASIDKAVEIGAKVEVVGRLQNPDGEIVTIDHGQARYIPGEGIENIVLTEKAQKVVVDGAIYIVRDGKMFNLQGAQVR